MVAVKPIMPAMPLSVGRPRKSPATSAAPQSDVTVDVYNGNPAAAGLATNVRTALVNLGYKAGVAENSTQQVESVHAMTQVFYGSGAAANAQEIALEFGTTATAVNSLPAGHVEVLLGSTTTMVPSGLTPSAAPTQGTADTSAQIEGARAADGPKVTSSPSPTATATNPTDSNAASSVTVAPNAKFGIPCVY